MVAARLRDRRIGPALLGNGRGLLALPAADESKAGRRVVDGSRRAHPDTLHRPLGILAGTVIDMTDPQLTIGGIVPAWFTPVFLGHDRPVVRREQRARRLLGRAVGPGLGLKSSRVATVLTGVIATVARLARVPLPRLPRHHGVCPRTRRHGSRPA